MSKVEQSTKSREESALQRSLEPGRVVIGQGAVSCMAIRQQAALLVHCYIRESGCRQGNANIGHPCNL